MGKSCVGVSFLINQGLQTGNVIEKRHTGFVLVVVNLLKFLRTAFIKHLSTTNPVLTLKIWIVRISKNHLY